jgi:hypothetical protein
MEDLAAIRERLARIEEQMLNSKDDRSILHTKLASQTEKIKHVEETTNQILRKIERYEGKFGGVLLTVGAVVAFFTMIAKSIYSNWEHIVAWFGRG